MEFTKYLSLFFMGLSVLMILRMLRTFRRVRSVSALSSLISIMMSLAFIVIYYFIVGTNLQPTVLGLILAAGLSLGMWQGRKTKVWRENNRVRAQNTLWFLVVWSLSYGFNQLLIVMGKEQSLNIGIGTMCLGTGVAWGSQIIILVKLIRISLRARKKITELPQGFYYPTPQPAAPPLTKKTVKRTFCRRCGFPIPTGDLFCRNCGTKV